MCGRFTSTTPASTLAALFDVDEVLDDDPGPRWNVAPTDEVWAVAAQSGERVGAERRRDQPSRSVRRLRRVRWGLVPAWAPDASGAARLINARAETLVDKPAFRDAFLRRRCLVPADGFYEWRPGPAGRQPFYFSAPDGAPLAFAGLYEAWRDPSDPGSPLRRTCTIVTTEANATVRPLHDRMPVVLPPPAWDEWLDPDTDRSDLDRLGRLLAPAPKDVLTVRMVPPLVNDVRRDGPDLVEPVGNTPISSVPSPSGRPEGRAGGRNVGNDRSGISRSPGC